MRVHVCGKYNFFFVLFHIYFLKKGLLEKMVQNFFNFVARSDFILIILLGKSRKNCVLINVSFRSNLFVN